MERMNEIWLPWLRMVGCPSHPATAQTASWIMVGVGDNHSRDFPFLGFMMRYWKMVVALRVFDRNLIPDNISERINPAEAAMSYSGCSIYTELLDSAEIEGMEGCVSPGRVLYAPCDVKAPDKEKYKMMRAYDFISKAQSSAREMLMRNRSLLRSMGLDPDNAMEGPGSYRMRNEDVIAIIEPAWFGHQTPTGMLWMYNEPVSEYLGMVMNNVTGDVRYLTDDLEWRSIWSARCLLSYTGGTVYNGHLDFKRKEEYPTEIKA